MKKYIIAAAALIIFLAVFIPLASSDPDGLEKVAETLGVEEQESIWKGIMPDYEVANVENQYLSTLIAGIFGTLAVLATGLIFGKSMAPKENNTAE